MKPGTRVTNLQEMVEGPWHNEAAVLHKAGARSGVVVRDPLSRSDVPGFVCVRWDDYPRWPAFLEANSLRIEAER